MKKIALIGNGGGGKSTLASILSRSLGLPLLEVDRIQFEKDWTRVAPAEVARMCDEFAEHDSWVIDGFGPWECIERRFAAADTIVFIDFPLWIHFWWAAERQIAAEKGTLLDDVDDTHRDYRGKTKEMFETLWHVDQNIKPKIDAEAKKYPDKLIHLRSPEEMEEWRDALLRSISQ